MDTSLFRNVSWERSRKVHGNQGSGKSSLAFDTLLAEGQRQYIESLSVYARQFCAQMQRPDVDRIDGLQPTIAIDQRPGVRNPRSTVATVTAPCEDGQGAVVIDGLALEGRKGYVVGDRR